MIKSKKNHISNIGFTLIEVIVAISVLGILSISVISLFTNSINANRRSSLKSKAIVAAQNKIEQLRIEDFSNLINYDGQVFTVDEIGGSGKIEILSKDWDENGTVEEYEEELAVAKITISWTRDKKNEEISLATYIAKNGINKR
jgi:prepilin-type N-terminal cleavage/methylation domain-containing protein